jgi:hypothetical protein
MKRRSPYPYQQQEYHDQAESVFGAPAAVPNHTRFKFIRGSTLARRSGAPYAWHLQTMKNPFCALLGCFP